MSESLSVSQTLRRLRQRWESLVRRSPRRPGSHASLSSVTSAYARWAPVYDVVFNLPLSFGRKAAVAEANRTRGKALEVGVGTGLSLPDYDGRLTVSGIDISEDMLVRARRRVADRKLANIAELRAMDAGDLAYEDASFDVAVVMYVMTVVPDPASVLRELERVVRPGGTVIIVNHFASERGLRAVVERGLAAFGSRLGWDPLFPKERILKNTRMTLLSEKPVAPMGLFSVLVFQR
ncbi:methyltransferase domain-containing protein [Stappia sp. F7233]|uniref:Methyltransferase domain-containing protein n=1 Tax=Stappia albiluteola TaxID=2758565 RepID=A0A839A9I6_9HYPH|nr:methyltransferase domain-containing protein [Stappia albiluteola]MBA5775704.1 methyltransferase domain-containing protein [Stappia albiluteola]